MEERTIFIGGRKSRVCIEDQFWECLEDLAAQRDTTWRRLVGEIARDHGDDLSSAIRVHVLVHYQKQLGFSLSELTATETACNSSQKYH
jgi:predicted DNA-binding ribbon-helix-helix protein